MGQGGSHVVNLRRNSSREWSYTLIPPCAGENTDFKKSHFKANFNKFLKRVNPIKFLNITINSYPTVTQKMAVLLMHTATIVNLPVDRTCACDGTFFCSCKTKSPCTVMWRYMIWVHSSHHPPVLPPSPHYLSPLESSTKTRTSLQWVGFEHRHKWSCMGGIGVYVEELYGGYRCERGRVV